MVCRTCGYEDSNNFSVCPFCGEKNSGQNQSMYTNQGNQYNQGNRPNQNNPSQYQTPFTQPNNPQNNQYNQGNQNNNYYSNPTNNYNTINQPLNEPVVSRPTYNASEMAHYFKGGIGSSFNATDNEITISRFLKGGEFVFWPKMFSFVMAILIVVGTCYGIHKNPNIMNNEIGIFGFLFVLVIAFIVKELGKFATITVNSNGITAKTMLGKIIIPREKVNYCTSQPVTRLEMVSRRRRGYLGYGRSRRRSEASLEPVTYLDVFVKTKEENKWKIDNIDTGLCYEYNDPVNYLKDEFNRILGVQEKI